MHKIIISDTSCFIILQNIGELDLLRKVYGRILTTVDIASEFNQTLPDWVEIVEVKDKRRQALLEMQIDKGESSAIALVLEISNSTIILDDYKARKIAEHLEVKITGTLGVIVKAKLTNVIPSIRPILQKIKETDSRLSEEIVIEALKKAGEL